MGTELQIYKKSEKLQIWAATVDAYKMNTGDHRDAKDQSPCE